MNKIEHIGIAVKDLKKSNELFAALFGEPHYKIEEVASEGVKTSFFKSGPNKIELLEATKADSPIAKFIEKKGEGIHHIAFAVSDIYAEIKRLKGIKTIIVIAHRLTTLSHCDIIYKIEQGKIVDCDNYDRIIKNYNG